MGCVESSRNVKSIHVIQKVDPEDGARRGSRPSGIAMASRTPLPNQVNEDDEDLCRLPTSELGNSTDWRRGAYTGRPAGASPDSGVFEFIGSDFQSAVIEHSALCLSQERARDFRMTNSSLDLAVTEQTCPRRNGNMRSEEVAILNLLEQEGFLAKDRAVSSGGLSYELVADDAWCRGNGPVPRARLPPLKLEKLEKRRNKHRARVADLCEEDISKKLEQAEERRKDAELEKMKRVAERVGSARPLELMQLEYLARVQKTQEKFENTLENREQHLEHLRARLRQHNERAAVVRLRKSLVTEDGTISPEGSNTAFTENAESVPE